jgi:uncharacterized protein (DUF3820 family)
MSFVPYLFIGIGETSAFFTLRETYLHEQWVGGQGGYMDKSVRSFHHFNLSQNAFEAFEKAKTYSEQMCIELKTSVEDLNQQMRDIKKASAEQLAERAAKMKAQEEENRAAYEEYLAERAAKIASGVFVFGPYKGQPFAEATRGYLSWMMDKCESFEEGSVLRLTAESVLKLVPHLALPKPDKTLTVGEPKKRLEFDVIVISSRNFVKDSFSGFGQEVCYVTTMVDKKTNACLICFSGAFSPNEGEEFKMKATVKDFSEYNGQAQTIVQRVTVL